MAPDALVPPTAVSGRSPRRVGAPRLLGKLGERRRVRPYEAIGAERERLWQGFASASPVDRYQRRTPRRIPVVVLTPADRCSGAKGELRPPR